MPAGKSLKASEKQAILKKLVTEMKKRYGGSLPKQGRSGFETLLFAVCLEDSPYKSAEAAYHRLLESFFDLNEIRVSSVTEIQQALTGLEDADWKAMRLRDALQHTFEKHYAFDLEILKRKTQDVAAKELEEIPNQTSFVRLYTVQQALGAHVLPIDNTMKRVLIWLGLIDAEATPESASEDLKSAVKKSDAPLLCHLLKCVATDPELTSEFEEPAIDGGGFDGSTAAARLAGLFKTGGRKRSKKAAKKAVSRKKPEKKAAARSSSAAKQSRKPAKKVTKKKPAASKQPARKRTR